MYNASWLGRGQEAPPSMAATVEPSMPGMAATLEFPVALAPRL